MLASQMTSLPKSLYRCTQVQALDKAAIKMQEVDGFELMKMAGQRAFNLLRHRWPETRSITVFCGGGNNGGDGYIVAALAAQAGFDVQVLSLLKPQRLNGSARLAYEVANSNSISIRDYVPGESSIKGVVVDALLGIGICGEVRDSYAAAIEAINNSKQPVLAIDIPSGICGDTGCVLGAAVKADSTITFIGLKQGLFTSDACEHCGDIVYEGLDVSVPVLTTQRASCERLNYEPPLLPARPLNSHKGVFGRAVVIGGDKSFGGAGIMTAEAALLSGAGLVSLATRPEHVSPALARRPELMVSGVHSLADLEPILRQADVLVVGPGVGQSSWSNEVVEYALKARLPSVIDADGLNLLAVKFGDYCPRDNWVLTPHPAEAGRLLGVSARKIQRDRFAAAKALQERFGGVIVLKGAGTIIATSNGLFLCSAGNPGMSTPGMGDVLSGIIGGLLAQGFSPSESAKTGVWAHSTAADKSVEKLGKHILATEIYADLRAMW